MISDRVGGVNFVFMNDWQIVVNEDVILDIKVLELIVEDVVIVWGFQGVGVMGNNLKMINGKLFVF